PMDTVVGSYEDDVIALLTGKGLVLAENGITRRFDDQAPEGEVLEQTPAPGTQVRPGDTFTLVVSQGPEELPVPDVTDKPVAQARTELSEAGFQVREERENSPTVAEGNVIRTEPNRNRPAPKGSVVVIVVSDGPPPVVMVEVPNVVNQTQ